MRAYHNKFINKFIKVEVMEKLLTNVMEKLLTNVMEKSW